MNIHVIGSTRYLEEDMPFMRAIVDTTHEEGGSIAHNWVEATRDRHTRIAPDDSHFDWPEIIDSNIEAIKRADALIVEGSRFNYSQGYQTAIALQYNKPVLNLYRKDVPEYEWPDKKFVSGVTHPKFTNKSYADVAALRKEVAQFLQDVQPKTKEIEVKISLPIEAFEHLSKLAARYDRSKQSIVKQILEESL